MTTDDFYVELSAHYDRMTRRSTRVDTELKMLQQWQQRLGFKTALDVACGTGLHALLLAKMGVKTTAVDASAAMLAIARKQAQEEGSPVVFIQSAMQDVQQNVADSFDVIFCLGNSLPHLLSKKELHQTLRHFHRLLNPGGHVVIQLLNYRLLLQQKQRIISITRQEDHEFIRFYDYTLPLVQFNVLHIDGQKSSPQHHLYSMPLFPYSERDVAMALQRQGFKDIQFYGDLWRAPFVEDNSINLVIVAEKTTAGAKAPK